MTCDTDGNNIFGDTKGLATIFGNGDVLIDISKLVPNETFNIVVGCEVGNKFVSASRKTDAKGRLTTLIPGLARSDGLQSGCGLPVVTTYDSDGPAFCYAAYGQP